MLKFMSLSSGSCGNCYYLGTEKGGVLIDAGVSLRRLKKVLQENDMDMPITIPKVVGDLLSIMRQLKEKGLPIDISVENTVVTYSEPVIKAVVDSDGKIVNGTWSCTVEVNLSDYKFAGSKVDSTVVVLDNTITVNGGFNP